MDDAAAHAFSSLLDVEPEAHCSPETAPFSEPKKDSDHDARTGRLHSVYDLSANDKLSRAMRARVTAEAAAEVALLAADGLSELPRPQTRADCLPGGCNETRPCPYVGCKYHLYLEVSKETGSVQVNFPGMEPWELSESCALDVVDREHGVTLEKVGELLRRTRERVRQIEAVGLEKARRHLKVLDD